MPSFFPEGDTPVPFDSDQRSLQKIVSLSGGGDGVSAASGIYTGAAPPAAPTITGSPAIFYPTGGGTVQQWDVASQAWV